MSSHTNISYSNTLYSSASSSKIDIKELNIIEDWDGRPASDWSVRRIGVLQSKIEQFTYTIYHSNRYGKHNLTKVIPNHILKQFANEAFGYDGWKMEVVEVEATECLEVPISQSSLHLNQLQQGESTTTTDQDFTFMVIAEAEVKITLKDGTNTKRTGVGKATMPSKGNCFSKAKKEAVSDALKKCLLGFEQIIIDYDAKKQKNYFVDGLYGSKDSSKHT
ncbi:DNA repair protein Rad59p [Monosporozyma unispora]|nr:mitotic recombination and DNA repair protein rad59 [Kazachstania unispora]